VIAQSQFIEGFLRHLFKELFNDECKKIDFDVLRRIKANAELVIANSKEFVDFEFGYSKESIKWLEGHIEHLRLKSSFDEQHSKFVSIFGSYLGEAITHNYGGFWSDSDGALGIQFAGENVAYPFAKVEKQMLNGLEDSIVSFFDLIPMLSSGELSKQLQNTKSAESKPPWWKSLFSSKKN
jgi:hypothetical protein